MGFVFAVPASRQSGKLAQPAPLRWWGRRVLTAGAVMATPPQPVLTAFPRTPSVSASAPVLLGPGTRTSAPLRCGRRWRLLGGGKRSNCPYSMISCTSLTALPAGGRYGMVRQIADTLSVWAPTPPPRPSCFPPHCPSTVLTPLPPPLMRAPRSPRPPLSPLLPQHQPELYERRNLCPATLLVGLQARASLPLPACFFR
jgi:hypothetical protein